MDGDQGKGKILYLPAGGGAALQVGPKALTRHCSLLRVMLVCRDHNKQNSTSLSLYLLPTTTTTTAQNNVQHRPSQEASHAAYHGQPRQRRRRRRQRQQHAKPPALPARHQAAHPPLLRWFLVPEVSQRNPEDQNHSPHSSLHELPSRRFHHPPR